MLIVHEETLLIDRDELRARWSVSVETIRKGIMRHGSVSAAWREVTIQIDDRKLDMIVFQSIPQSTLDAYSIPEHDTLYKEALAKTEGVKLRHAIYERLDRKGYLYQSIKDAHAGIAGRDVEELATAVILLNAYADKQLYSDLYGHGRRKEFTNEIIHLIGELNSKFLRVTSEQVLMRKVREASEQGAIIALFKCKSTALRGNKNRLCMTSWHKWAAEALLSMPLSYTRRIIADMVNRRAVEEGLKQLDYSTYLNYLARPEVLTRVSESRYGRKEFENSVRPYVVRDSAMFPGDCWMMDGTRAQFAIRDDADNRVKFVSFYVVIDVFTRKIVGWSASLGGEDRHVVMKALEMAVIMAGHLPFEIVKDNASATGTAEFRSFEQQLAALGVSIRSAKVGNAKDKTYVERFFGGFDDLVGRQFHNWVGKGIRSKSLDAHPSPEYLDLVAKAKTLPNFEGMICQFADMIARYNDTATRSRQTAPNVLFQESEKPTCVKIDEYQLADLFWAQTLVTVRNSMLAFEVRKVKRHYTIWDHDTKLHYNGVQIAVRYDLHKLDKVHLFDAETGDYLGEATQVVKPITANAHASDENSLRIIKQEAHAKAYEKHIARSRQDLKEAAAKIADTNLPAELLNPATASKSDLARAEEEKMLTYMGIEHDLSNAKHVGIIEQPTPYLDGEPLLADTPSKRTEHHYIPSTGSMRVIED